ncbi:hypothetical protein ABPG72_014976 [Tetrahymena utriculariae]
MGNYFGRSQVNLDDVKLKSCQSLVFHDQIDYIIPCLLKDIPNFQQLSYLANDEFNLILQSTDVTINQKFGLRIAQWKVSDNQHQKQDISTSFITPQQKICFKKFLIKTRLNEYYFVQQFDYNEYIKYLQSQCIEQKMNIYFLVERHHTITNLFVTAIGKSQIVPQTPQYILYNYNMHADQSLNENHSVFFGAQISKCLFLKNLNLIIPNNFISKGCLYLGFQIGKCLHLQTLIMNIFNNSIGFQDIKPLFCSLSYLNDLKILDLDVSFNKIDLAVYYLSESLSKLTKLEKLSLKMQKTNIDEHQVGKLAQVISKQELLNSLTLNLNYNPINEKGVLTLFSEISQCSFLKNLKISLNKIRINQISALSIGQAVIKIKKLNNLQLDLSETDLNDQGLPNLVLGINSNILLQELIVAFDSNFITHKGFKNFGEEVGKCESIKKLAIENTNNPTDDEGVIDFMKALKNLKNLTSFIAILDNNYMSSSGLSQALSELNKNCSKLSEIKLGLSTNKLEYNTNLVAFALEQFDLLISLDISLQNNYIQDEELQLFAEKICKFSKLKILSLNLAKNEIQNPEKLQKFAFYISQIKQLQKLVLDLSENQLGDIGVQNLVNCLSNIQNLRHLVLHLNNNLISVEGYSLLAKSFRKYQNLNYLILNIQENNFLDLELKHKNYLFKTKKLVSYLIIF